MKLSTTTTEAGVLPGWVFPWGFRLALPVLLASMLWPQAADAGLWFMMGLPAFAAITVVHRNWSTDRTVSLAALTALGGVLAVVVLKSLLL